MSVIPLRRPVIANEPTGHVLLSAAARESFTALEAQVGKLRRIFAGPSAPAVMAARIDAIALEVRIEAQKLARLSR